ncbi:family C2 unassigned peptidase (C02 family) [Echinococcus multilocularis]|uniref:Family C2 unassigned peptidase (C02 family) n=1 Tax=Echinococcus multilocularis TaxID=6211 RepID=A0A068XZA3_ECHMU|nr:family C2 unassigned peptidase (C02 family) [Echinococcus multilocularis]
MAQIGFNIPLLTDLGDGWQTHRSPPPRPPSRREPAMRAHQKPQAASIKRQIRQKEIASVILHRRFVASESLEHSKKWFKREVEAQLQRGGLFEDPFMPPVDSTIWPDRSNSSAKYRWRRPSELVAHPQFVADGLSRFDIRQGELGDCWLIAALACLSMHHKLLNELSTFQVVPCGQSFVPTSDGGPLNAKGGFAYVGMFWFRFWYFGCWVDVVVDDRLPTSGNRLCFMHSSDRQEFWSALLELVGSYDALRGGTTSEGMEDFTGGMCEMIDLGDKAPENLFSIMSRAHSRCSLLACSIDASPEQMEAEGPYGLIMGHAYSVTDIRTVRETSGNQLQMIRLRNPWGNEREWVGPWSDKSKEWSRISPEERMKIGLTFDNDGEFWMTFGDFKHYFSRLEMCHLSPDFDQMDNTTKGAPPKRKWEMTRHEGEWLRNSTAGGCPNYQSTFHMNPQIRVSVVDADEADDDPTGTIVVGLMQKGMREKRQSPFSIGYIIYPLPPGAPPNALLTSEFFLRTKMAARPMFVNTREVCGRHKLIPGDYVIVPSTFMPNEEAKFLLRIFSERPYAAGELDDQIMCGVDPITPLPALPKDEEMIKKLKSAFDAIAGDTGDIEAEDLRNILNRAFENKVGECFEGFSLETARSMVALMDVDTSGTLGFEEFKTLWYELRLWLTIFKEADAAKAGKLCTYDLRNVLSDVGISISNEIFKAIVCRYAHDGVIVFDDFVLLLVRLITVFGKFKENLEDRKSLRASFFVDEFLRCVLYT